MSEIKPNSNRVVTAPEILDFINKTATVPIYCPSCQKQDWVTIAPTALNVNEPVNVEILTVGTYDPKTDSVLPFSVSAGEPIIRVMCNNCSYCMIYSYLRMKELILNQEAKG
ncbi:hypothetical protein RUM78_000679 [Enterobacter hormaechei]|uniref:hypothetical protein n=1 Tax=Enterobacter cloacae complex TaxID=354276 RepID=UPI001C03D9F4|nr:MULTISPECIES: hypothetical protein [Enterobacter cloacae complex]ELJ9646320.1 hypothetical protein [Enterobacter hormaechei]MBU0249182.1 hypothetical protein [Enterobacter hormaechei]MCU6250324.1 hypothetical protein [Enterobacter cloacae]MDS6675780.1 hypothetical protein [Enterobacter hormaechei]MDS6707127.1 hypothetical protein [Enterobacter hormaechei]